MWRLLRKFDETLRKSAGVKHPQRPPWPPCGNQSAKFAHAAAHNVLSADRMALPEQVSGLLIDIDGTMTEAHSLVPGVPEALALLQARNVPYRLVTNTTSKPRSSDPDPNAKPWVGGSCGRRHHGANHRAGVSPSPWSHPLLPVAGKIRSVKIWRALSSLNAPRKRCLSATLGRNLPMER
jgi:hypothetical protein